MRFSIAFTFVAFAAASVPVFARLVLSVAVLGLNLRFDQQTWSWVLS